MPLRATLTHRQKDVLLRLPASQADLLRHYTLADRQARLDIRLRELGRVARTGDPWRVHQNGVLHIEKLEAAAPSGAKDMVLDLYKAIPPTRITDLLLEVDAATGFCEPSPISARERPAPTGLG